MDSGQLNLFSEVLQAYTDSPSQPLSNAQLYEHLSAKMDKAIDSSQHIESIGAAQQTHNVLKRKIRWFQQTLKHAGILERVEGLRGVWQLAHSRNNALTQMNESSKVVGFSTELGVAIIGSCRSVFGAINEPISLLLTSPPYPLANARRYGNPSESEYVDWICHQIEPLVRNLVPGGSICLNISNDIFLHKSPARSMYRERLVLALHDRLGLWKMDELIWVNPTKPPGPVRYASIDRTQLNVAYEPIYWFTNNPALVCSDNRRVLMEHSAQHLRLINQGGETRNESYSDGAYQIRPGSFKNPTAGKIPRNILTYAHRCAAQLRYKKWAQAQGLPVHGAPMPLKLAEFLVKFLSKEGDLVVDPFAGSFTTAHAAQNLGRRWISTERIVEYVIGGASRFINSIGFETHFPQYQDI